MFKNMKHFKQKELPKFVIFFMFKNMKHFN